MQQSLKHIDLPLQLIDTTYLLSNQQVTQIIVLLFAGDGEDDGAGGVASDALVAILYMRFVGTDLRYIAGGKGLIPWYTAVG